MGPYQDAASVKRPSRSSGGSRSASQVAEERPKVEKSNQTITHFGPDSNLNAVYYRRVAWRVHASCLLVRSSTCDSEGPASHVGSMVSYPGAIDGRGELC